MSYRDTAQALRAYRDRVTADLEEARRAAAEAAQRGARVRELETELAETERLLADVDGRAARGLPMLDDVRIATPCSASWDEMTGDERVRFCAHCQKYVFNLSAMPREEAEALLLARGDSICVRLFRRSDGTVMTADCPVGVGRRRRRIAAGAAVGGGLLAAGVALSAASRTTMGGIDAQRQPRATTQPEPPAQAEPEIVVPPVPPLEPTVTDSSRSHPMGGDRLPPPFACQRARELRVLGHAKEAQEWQARCARNDPPEAFEMGRR
jgi:hypothetical protein